MATTNNWADYENYFEEGKQLMIFITYCENSCDDSDINSTTFNLNHEEVAHGMNRLLSIIKSQDQEHMDYNDEAGHYSPSNNEIRKKSRYKNSEAKKQIDEIDKIKKYKQEPIIFCFIVIWMQK